MPGRQSTLRSSKPPRKPRKFKSRTLDALAIAERQNPTRVKISRYRLGEVEDDGKEPQRRHHDAEDGGSGNEDGHPSKRRKTVKNPSNGDLSSGSDEGSDSDGNHWRMGAVDSDDDSDLDSDEAIGESDEERYKHYTFRGSSGSKLNGHDSELKRGISNQFEQAADVDISEGDESTSRFSQGEKDDDLGEDAVDLATALDMNEAEEADHDRESPAATARRKKGQGEDGADYDKEATGSDEDSESSDLSVSEDEDQGTNSKALSKLQDFISSVQSESEQATQPRKRYSNAQEQSAPSEFGVTPTQKLTVADLISTVTDPRLKNSLKLLSSAEKPASTASRGGIPGKLAVPLPKRQQDKLDREAAYEKSKETLDRWIETVKHNRRAEHLSFPLADPDTLAAQGTKRFIPTSSSKPSNDLEGTIQAILQESGLQSQKGVDKDAQIQALEELQSIRLPLEEVQARRAELRRARDLLFREEVRARRIKKIKSKSYRKVHRKERKKIEKQEREALVAAGVELSEDELELNDRRRAEERMGARHRASRWAKGMKETGRATWDEEVRGGVNEMARKGEELRRKIEGKHVPSPDDDDFLEPSSSESDDELPELADQGGASRRWHERGLNRLGHVNGDPKDESGLMSMKFMKNAEAARKAANDADVERLRRELNGEDSPSEEELEETGRRKFGLAGQVAPQKPQPIQNPQPSEFEEKLTGSDKDSNVDEEDEQLFRVGGLESSQSYPAKKVPVRAKLLQSSTKNVKSKRDAPVNPWLSGPSQSLGGQRQQHASVSHDAPIIIANPSPQRKPSRPSKPSNPRGPSKDPAARPNIADTPSSPSDSDADSPSTAIGHLHRNATLVKAAFAGDDVFTNFSAEKDALAASEDEQEVSTALPGWGSWTGAGISKKELKRQQAIAKDHVTKVPGVKASDRKDANLTNVSISEKRVRKNVKYLASQLPHPFESRKQYERSLRLPVGPEWTTKETFQNGTKPRVMVKKGVVIGAMEKPIV